GEDDLGGFGDGARRIGPFGALGQERLGRGAVEVVDGELMAGLLQIGRHALAHHAEPDKTDAHCFLRCANRPRSSAASVVGSAARAQAARRMAGSRSFRTAGVSVPVPPKFAHSYVTRSGRSTVTRLSGEGRDPFVRAREFAGWVPAS